jgi:hypothetical protein
MTEKLDGKFYGDIFKAKDRSPVRDDQWAVFLAKDNAFAAILMYYRDECVFQQCDPEQIAAVDRMIERVKIWRAAHPELCKKPDAKGERMLDLP